MRALFAGLVVAAFVLAGSSSARADLPPPDGQKFADFGFKVKGINASAGRVLFAYPCGQSSGAPIAQHQKLQEGTLVSVGRRGGPCTIYSIAQADYDAFAKDYKPTMAGVDPALDALSKKAQRCEGAPSLSFTLPKSDPRQMVEETLEVVSPGSDGGATCKLKSVASPATAIGATGSTAAASATSDGGSAPATPSSSSSPASASAAAGSSSSTPAAATPKKDSGCTMVRGTGSTPSGSGLWALLAIGLVLSGRRLRR